ncbi:DnaB-like helicase C-terminal domain-containing protein (plasmid) [Borreliella californiensis]|uniref:DnaB-like helicase C-terminal domain-containing protein n=1 Tax=Borreliella californiensis TaxID=373543 RepID=A0A7W9ZM73_9SPIR|nr:replicative DNA helicase [Borreliella californiensis]MBB6213695.1 replicative DNA helicase [Borreliella californiensis]
MLRYFQLNNLSFYIKSMQGIQIHKLKAQARKMKKNYNIQIIFIDYIGLITMLQNNVFLFEQYSFSIRTIMCTCF